MWVLCTMNVTSAGALLATLCLAIPATAGAAKVGVDDGVLTYAGESGEANELSIELAGGEYELYDNAALAKGNHYSVTYGPGCERRNAKNDYPIVCKAAGCRFADDR